MATLSLSERANDVSVLEVTLPAAYGTFLIGTFLGILLYGLSAHQTYRYIRSFPTDGAYIRLLVIVVMILETLHVVANMHTCFHYLVSNFATSESLIHGTWSLAALPILQGLITVVAQIFFIRRVSLLGPLQRMMANAVVITLVGELGFSAAATVLSFTRKEPATVNVLSGAALAMAAVADTTLSIALVQAIRTNRAREPRESEPLIDVIQLYVINTGIATGVFNLFGSIFAIALPVGSLLFAALCIIATRLYANSLLAVLNSRELRGMEFFISGSFSSVTLEGAQFADKSALWNVPKTKQPRVATSGGNPPQFTNPWVTAMQDKQDVEKAKGDNEHFWSMSL